MKLIGTWINEAGSRLTISSIDKNSVLGNYSTALGSPSADEEFPVYGKCTDKLFSFTVNFEGHQSICVWNGYYNSKKDSIEVQWLLSSSDSEIPMSLRTGNSVFVKEAQL